MKKILLPLLLALTASTLASAQCENKIIWHGSKAEFLDESGSVRDTKEGQVTITTTGKYVLITHSDDEADTLAGPVKVVTCAWTTPFKEGKLVYQGELSERSGDTATSTLTVEAKESKILIYLHFERPDGRKMTIRIPVESYTSSN